MAYKVQRYGWIPDLPDHRDYLFAAAPELMGNLPPRTDLRANCPPVYNQGQLGSCTANAVAGAIEFDQKKQGLPDFMPSRLFIYYNERVIEHTVNSDSGAMLRDGIKAVSQKGACTEDLWKYDITSFRNPPTPAACADALKHRAVTYQRLIQNLSQLKGCLAAGYPFVFGFSVYAAFESEQMKTTGHLSLPAPGEDFEGGHAVMAVGYDDAQQWFIIRNSWGETWGMQGYFTMPYAYLTDSHLANDFWTIRQITAAEAAAAAAAAAAAFKSASVAPPAQRS